uniref:Zinc finger protein n=2 Tax=Ciona intestinalis TaxID=7719 RepID=Q1RPU2_CIOIN|nr:zinc finger protein [Ciona intestinalis]BAE93343.1 zinc finger protein [Ciona intestinalis]|eukprot:NP_001071936.1 zinc finger protein [Ciona intestinalis]
MQIKTFKMGQFQSINSKTVRLSILDDSVALDETYDRVERMLRNFCDTNEEKEILSCWEKAVSKKCRNPLQLWSAFGLAMRALENWGKHRSFLAFSIRQVELSQEFEKSSDLFAGMDSVNSAILVADSYLNMAKGNLLMSQYKNSEKYATKCLSVLCSVRKSNLNAIKLSGYAYLYKARSNLGFSNFRNALEDLERSLRVAHDQEDRRLECFACCAMGALYLQLKDYEKGNFFSIKSCEIWTQCGSSWSTRTKVTTQLNLAEAYRKVGKIEDAMVIGEEAMKIAIENDDRSCQAYAMLCFADIHRVRKDEERSLPRYNSASGLMLDTGDQFGYMMSTIGKAKLYLQTKDYQKAIQEYFAGQKIAEAIGNKITSMHIHGELALLFQRLSNQDEARVRTLRYHRLLETMELFCGICAEPMAEKNEQLEALPCSHFFHLKCVSNNDALEMRMCPSCQKKPMKQATL